jgi:hypothetical protein
MRHEQAGPTTSDAPDPQHRRHTDEGVLDDAVQAAGAVHGGHAQALGPEHWTALQRTAGNAAVVQAQAAGSAVRAALAQPGRALDPSFRSEAEAHLGADLSDVRLHDDAHAAASAEAVQANAYTSGNHVVFGTSQLDTQSASGRNRLVHELAHTVQQRQGAVEGTVTEGGLSISDPSDRFEREAEEVAGSFE